jgi:hypothetical protein
MIRKIKAVRPLPKENCCGKQVKKAERKKIIYKKIIKKKNV